jgi:hypothetical protein
LVVKFFFEPFQNIRGFFARDDNRRKHNVPDRERKNVVFALGLALGDHEREETRVLIEVRISSSADRW